MKITHLAALAGLALAAPTSASAQSLTKGAAKATTVAPTVLVGMRERLERNAYAIIMRRSVAPHHLILVSPQTSPAEFAIALAAHLDGRQTWGDSVRREGRAFLTRRAVKASAPPEGSIRYAEGQLARLRTAPARSVSGLGRMPTLQVAVPADLLK